jgi:hypothetical protein
MNVFLSTFRPLLRNRAGRQAIAKFDLPPYVDSSCRREPDLEHVFPSVSALCHGKLFAPRLHERDVVAFITKKDWYGAYRESHWRLVAIVRVVRRFQTHADAADWYQNRDLTLPSNCIVPGNPPLPLERTDRYYSDLHEWELGYRLRARRCGTFLACEPIHRSLYEPPIITEAIMRETFGRIPGTRNPPQIEASQLARLCQLTGIDLPCLD